MAESLTVAEFRARFPQFVDPPYTDAVIQAAIDDTVCNFDIERWDCFYKRGHSLYIAHLFTVYPADGSNNAGTGALDRKQSKAADGVSVSYATMTPSDYTDAFFAGTKYGSEYLMLVNSVGIGSVAICAS